MESDREESIETTLRIMAIIMRQKDKTIQVDFTPEFMEEVADEIKNLREAGDALAEGIRTGRWDDALDAWTELRGG